jgi:hypothetical protein
VEETNDVAGNRKESLATGRNKFKAPSLCVHQFRRYTSRYSVNVVVSASKTVL